MAKGIHNFKKGEHVTVFRTDWHGNVEIEGSATITRLLDGEDRYNVCFTHAEAKFQGLMRTRFERYVDPNGQADPQGWCDKINAKIGFPVGQD